jgi:hypothetical protein
MNQLKTASTIYDIFTWLSESITICMCVYANISGECGVWTTKINKNYALSPHVAMPGLKYPTHSAENRKEDRATNCKILIQTTSADLPERIVIAGNVKDANSNCDLFTSFFKGNLGC